MKLALISDTHGQLPPVELFESADAIIHAGDIGVDYRVGEWIEKFYRPWRERLPAPLYATLGNHDFESKWLGERSRLLLSQSVEILGLHFFFSPWSPTFGDWAWMRSEPGLTEIYNTIPKHTNIIVSHSPPYQLCDRNAKGEPCGSKALRVRIKELPMLSHVICGHIHEARGEAHLGNVTILNVSSVDEQYEMHDNPITWLEV